MFAKSDHNAAKIRERLKPSSHYKFVMIYCLFGLSMRHKMEQFYVYGRVPFRCELVIKGKSLNLSEELSSTKFY